MAEVLSPADVNLGFLLSAKCALYINANASKRNSFFIKGYYELWGMALSLSHKKKIIDKYAA